MNNTIINTLEQYLEHYRTKSKGSNNNDSNYYNGIIDGLLIALKEIESNK